MTKRTRGSKALFPENVVNAQAFAYMTQSVFHRHIPVKREREQDIRANFHILPPFKREGLNPDLATHMKQFPTICSRRGILAYMVNGQLEIPLYLPNLIDCNGLQVVNNQM